MFLKILIFAISKNVLGRSKFWKTFLILIFIFGNFQKNLKSKNSVLRWDGEFGVGWRVCDTSSRKLCEVKHTCPLLVNGLESRLVFTGSIPVLHTDMWFQKHLKPISGCSYDHRTDEGGQSGNCKKKN